jgi:wyosine [tRNA(Phe)-imidazoG37] synthetase (radical SAM superfamily)
MINERKDFFPPQEILDEIQWAVDRERGNIDFVTFVGEGEPTLCKSLGWLIKNTKELTAIPIAVDTNGALLYRADLRNDLLEADVVMPSLDAGTAETFKKINRPHRALDFKTIVEGMVRFRHEYTGELWMEIMLVKGINDSENELKALKSRLEMIEPDRIYINVPIRPPAEPWAVSPDKEAIALAQAILSDGMVATIAAEEEGTFSTEGFTNPEDAIVAIIRRHPMREEQVIETLRKFKKGEIAKSLRNLEECGKITKVKYREKIFWLTEEEKRGKK